MEQTLAALEAVVLVETLRTSRWLYAAFSAVHIAAIGLLFGATVPLALRFLGLWSGIPREAVVRVLVPMATLGFVLAILSGLLLFSVRAREYADVGVFQVKLLLIAAGVLSAVAAHTTHGLWLRAASRRSLTVHALASLVCWSGALICGRLIAFADT